MGFFFLRCYQVRTLFVSGLPMDAKPRELYLLFRAYDGYENSQLKVTSKNGKTTSVIAIIMKKLTGSLHIDFCALFFVSTFVCAIVARRLCYLCYQGQCRVSQAGFAGKIGKRYTN